MKRSELKSLIREILEESPLPPRSAIDPNINELLATLKDKMAARQRKSGGGSYADQDAFLAMLTNLLVTGGWKKTKNSTEANDTPLSGLGESTEGFRLAKQLWKDKK